MSDEIIKPPSTFPNILNPLLNYVGIRIRVEVKGSCLKQDKISFDHGKIVNIYIVYEINRYFNISSYQTLENVLFDTVELTKHPDIDQYKYSGCVVGFDRKGFLSLGNEIDRNAIFFGVDMSSFPHIENKKKYISILGKGPTQGSDWLQKNYIQSILLKIMQNFV